MKFILEIRQINNNNRAFINFLIKNSFLFRQ